MKNYETNHPDYSNNLYRWKKVNDCVDLKVKDCDWRYAMANSGYAIPTANDYYSSLVYLPYPTNSDDVTQNYSRYLRYLQRAIFAAYTKRTHDAFLGMVFRKKPAIELPESMADWSEDVSGTGLSLTQVAKSVLSSTAKTGRSGIYVTYPATSEDMTAEQTANLQPEIKLYHAQDIINWSDDDSLIVLCETYQKDDDEFKTVAENEYQYRVLRLRDGVATSQVYRDDYMSDESVLIDGNGNAFDYIPFHWVGTVNNDNKIDESLLEGIADLNIGHYRNSADLEENCFIHGQATLFMGGKISVEEFTKANPNGVEIGAQKGHWLGDGGNAQLVQAQPNQVADNLMKRKEDQMLSLGAAIVSGVTFQSATEAEINASTESANLVSLVDNVTSAMRLAIIDAARYAGLELTEDDFIFELNKEFYPEGTDAQQLMAMVQLYDRGIVGDAELRQPLRNAGSIERTDEEIDEERANRGLV